MSEIMPDTAVVWFRRDLRLADNPALAHALAQHQRVILIYIYAPEEETPWQPGGASLWWLQKSLRHLQNQTRRLGGEFYIYHGATNEVINGILEELVQQHRITAVYWNRLYDATIMARDRSLKNTLKSRNIIAKSFSGYLLAEPWLISNQQGNPYQVYTPFSKRVRAKLQNLATPLLQPQDLQQTKLAQGPLEHALVSIESLPWLQAIPSENPWYEKLANYWQPGEISGHQTLEKFAAQDIKNYIEMRDYPSQSGATSSLSPYLHYGEITAKQIWFSICHHHGIDLSESAEKFIQQLIWRDFSHHILFHYPAFDKAPKQSKFAKMQWLEDIDNQKLQRWQRGQTGIPVIDAGMRELWQTGTMHNRVRMLVASFLTKNLRLHWHKGARWFWDTLVDANLANNSQGWQWTAGCGTDAGTIFRIFNPVSQAEKFDVQASYIDQYVPELKALPVSYRFAPWTAPESVRLMAEFELGRDYPEPIVDLKQSRLEALLAFKKLSENN